MQNNQQPKYISERDFEIRIKKLENQIKNIEEQLKKIIKYNSNRQMSIIRNEINSMRK